MRSFLNPKQKVNRFFLLIVLAMFVLILSFPILVTILTSLKSSSEVHTIPATWIPQDMLFRNYLEIFSKLDLVSALKSSLIVSISSALLTVIAALPAGYALARFHFFGRRFLLTAILAGLMFSPVVVLISIYQILSTVGLMNTYFALILPNTAFALPFSIWLTMAYVKSLPTEIDESAVLDGAGYSRILFTIVAPLIAPSVVTVFVYAFIQSWNEFLFSKSFITSDSLKTLPVRLYEFVGYRGIEWQYMTASIVVTTVPCIILFFSVQRWLVKGLVSGAVRG